MTGMPANDDRELPAATIDDWRSSIPSKRRWPALTGVFVLALFAAAFFVWGVMAPLSGAVIAPGVVQAAGQNQTISHLEGGIIQHIHAKEGDYLKGGQALISLDTVQVATELNRILTAFILKRAEYWRALAERSDAEQLEFPDVLKLDAKALDLHDDLEQQIAEFDNRLGRHRSQLDVIARRVDAITQQIVGLEAQLAAEQEKLAILRTELADKENLLKQGLTQTNDVNALRRARVESAGQVGAIMASIAERQATIAELDQERQSLVAARQETAAIVINELRGQINDLHEQAEGRRDTLARAVIRAPVNGTIVSLAKNTIGSVIGAGEIVAEILPADGESLVEARVNPIDADVVLVGQRARLRLVALNMRTTPELSATVQYVSADRILDTTTGEPYYTARLVAEPPTDNQGIGHSLGPGMPVEVLFVTEPRTFASYLLQPVTDSLARAFREE